MCVCVCVCASAIIKIIEQIKLLKNTLTISNYINKAMYQMIFRMYLNISMAYMHIQTVQNCK